MITFAQFFRGGVADSAFVVLGSLGEHCYESAECEAAEFAPGEYDALETAHGNNGILKIWNYGGAPEEVALLRNAYAGDEEVPDLDDYAEWLLREAGATETECEQVIEAETAVRA